MASPYFFEENLPDADEFILSEETSRHIIQVLRMNQGERIILTSGKGYTLNAIIISADKKKTKIKITDKQYVEKPFPAICIGISLIKNNNRFEMFVEKATEIGVSTIIPLLCRRSEKTHFKKARTRAILISAMLQSQQSWLPEISEPVKIEEILTSKNYDQKFIAHCIDGEKTALKNLVQQKASKIILIGPEGDFTEEEIEAAIQQNYIPVSLGETRLRTETAGIVAAVLLK